MVAPYLILLGLLALERLVELHLSRRHVAWALARGGKEFGQKHFNFMKLLHSVFLFSCAAEVLLLNRPFIAQLGLPMLGLALAAQALRYWAIFTLGPYSNVRVVVVPGATPVSDGPYRYLRHPNYLAVIVEGVAVPLIHTAWITAVGFSLLNAFLLWTRIRCEEEALAIHCSYDRYFGNRARFLPLPGP